MRDISGRFSDATAALLTEYRGLTVTQIGEVRSALREAEADYKVLKNTLARIAVREVGLDELAGMLEGPTAIAFCRGDAVEAAKALDEATKKFPFLVVKGGVLRGKVIDAEQARALARLESREVLLAKTAMLFNAPAQQAVNVLAALLRNLGSMLAQVAAKKEAGEGFAPAASGTEPSAPSGEEPATETVEAPGEGEVVQPAEVTVDTEAADAEGGAGARPQAGAEEAPAADEPPAELPEAQDQAAAAPQATSEAQELAAQGEE